MLLITGGSSYVGRHLLYALGLTPAVPFGDPLPVYHSHTLRSGQCVDLTSGSAVRRLMDSHDITGVIHLAAEARPAMCETDSAAAYKSNVTITQNLIKACKTRRPYFLHVSTDMVFKGDRGDYSEHDPPDATCVYGRTKLAAEHVVQNYVGPWCIVRPALIFGPPIAGKISSLSWTLNTLKSPTGHFFSDELRTPVWIDDLVELLIALAKARAGGIVHAGGPQRLSRLEFAQITADVWGIPRSSIRSTSLGADSANSWRPRDVSLRSGIAAALHDFSDVPTALQTIKKRSMVETEVCL